MNNKLRRSLIQDSPVLQHCLPPHRGTRHNRAAEAPSALRELLLTVHFRHASHIPVDD